jgi:hypothetical protein
MQSPWQKLIWEKQSQTVQGALVLGHNILGIELTDPRGIILGDFSFCKTLIFL